jgi:hypothetical protein
MFGVASLPAWRMTQPSRDESNSLVNRRGKGVGEGAGVEVGSGVDVAGIGVGEARRVDVGKREAVGARVADWQAVRRMKHPIRRIFFMALITAGCKNK